MFKGLVLVASYLSHLQQNYMILTAILCTASSVFKKVTLNIFMSPIEVLTHSNNTCTDYIDSHASLLRNVTLLADGQTKSYSRLCVRALSMSDIKTLQ